MKSRLQRYRALQSAMEKLKVTAECDLGRAMQQRQNILRQISDLEAALQKQSLFGDLVLVAGALQMTSLAKVLQETDKAIGKLRKRAVDYLLKAKRMGVAADHAGRTMALSSARIEIAELTDQGMERRASLPQAKRS